MGKSGWKKSNVASQVDRDLMARKSSASEAKNAFGPVPDVEREKYDLPTRPLRIDPITDHLGCTSFEQSKRWTWLCYHEHGIRYSLDATRFYQEINVAIDFLNEMKLEHLDLKKRLFAEQGVRYVILKNRSDIAGLSRGDA